MKLILFSVTLVFVFVCLIVKVNSMPTIADLNQQLLSAARRDKTTKIVRLLNLGADANTVDAQGSIALMLVLQSARYSGIQITLPFKQKSNASYTYNENLNNVSTSAIKDTRSIQALLDKGADPNIKNKQGRTALIFAAFHKSTSCIRLLVERGADIHIKDAFGRSAIIYAAGYGHTEMLKYLISKGLSPNDKTEQGATVLMQETLCGSVESILFLLSTGADVNMKDNNGRTALQYAVSAQNLKVIPLL